MKIGLFFGSFNPIHTGHLIIANFMATHTGLEQVWLVVSPHNPLKPKSTLANDYERLHLVHLAIEDNPRLRASDIEFRLPKPSYTVDTLQYFQEKYPQHDFTLIMGGDNLSTLHKWKNYEILLRDYTIFVYRRPHHEANPFPDARIHFFDAPLMDISASFIRLSLQAGKSIRYFVPDAVFRYLENSRLYR